MSRRSAGVAFVAIGAFLFASRYLAAAIFGSNVSSWNADLFQAMLQYVGDMPAVLASISAVAGVGYLIWAELDERRGV